MRTAFFQGTTRKRLGVMLNGSCYTVLSSSLANLQSSTEHIGSNHFISLLAATILAAGTTADSGLSRFGNRFEQ